MTPDKEAALGQFGERAELAGQLVGANNWQSRTEAQLVWLAVWLVHVPLERVM